MFAHAMRATDPTPAQIRQRCREIQETWSPETEMRRRGIRWYRNPIPGAENYGDVSGYVPEDEECDYSD